VRSSLNARSGRSLCVRDSYRRTIEFQRQQLYSSNYTLVIYHMNLASSWVSISIWPQRP
jgi:hypothetical protein